MKSLVIFVLILVTFTLVLAGPPTELWWYDFVADELYPDGHRFVDKDTQSPVVFDNRINQVVFIEDYPDAAWEEGWERSIPERIYKAKKIADLSKIVPIKEASMTYDFFWIGKNDGRLYPNERLIKPGTSIDSYDIVIYDHGEILHSSRDLSARDLKYVERLIDSIQNKFNSPWEVPKGIGTKGWVVPGLQKSPKAGRPSVLVEEKVLEVVRKELEGVKNNPEGVESFISQMKRIGEGVTEFLKAAGEQQVEEMKSGKVPRKR